MTRLLLVCLSLAAQSTEDAKRWLEQPLLDPKQPQLEVQVYTASRVPPVSIPASAVEWDRYATRLRRDMLDRIVFRGEAARWRTAARKVEWLDTQPGQGYRLRRLRFEAVPGLWIPALLYEPEQLDGKVPVVLNVNGHERTGISTPYIQVRCINLARRGMLAFNAEWLGRGQFTSEDYSHARMPQIDLTGASGLAVFYLLMERSLDVLLSHENADPNRVAVTGLSGGGWQTTFISSLDTRVKLSVPVAGHSSFVTRAQWPELDLGDSEQTPSDMATVADYLHLTAITAPRPLMLINNAKDNCCFRADYAMGPLLQTARQVYALHGAHDKLRYYINHGNGHNYDQDSREELYRLLGDEFLGGRGEYKEISADAEVRTADQLRIPLPENNATFHSLALALSRDLPRAGEPTREQLAALLRAPQLGVDAREVKRDAGVIWWRLRMGGAWTVPAVEIGPRSAGRTVLLFGDAGRKNLATEAARLAGQGSRVIAFDPFYFGESKIATRDYLFALLVAALGERPLGLQASQIAAVARWAGQPVTLEAHGRRLSLAALAAAALEPKAIAAAHLHGSMRSLREILDENLTVDKHPELFCFGLLEQFDIPQIARLASSVSFSE